MRDRLAAILLVLVVGSAGCLGNDDVDSGDADPDTENEVQPPAPLELPWSLTGCRAAVVFFDVPADRVRPHLPEGFEPDSVPEGLGGPEGSSSEGSFGTEMLACDSGDGLDGPAAGLVYGSHFTFVRPPPDVDSRGAQLTFFKWTTLVPDAPRRDVLGERGLSVVDGNATWSTFERTGSVTRFDGTLAMEGHEYRFMGTTAVPSPPVSDFIEFMTAHEELASWYTRVADNEGSLGTGTVVVPAGTIAADILGAGTHEGTALAGTWRFTDGRIQVPHDGGA